MFTGIIQTMGTVQKVERARGVKRITIKTDSKIVRKVPEGGSVNIDGVCLTAITTARGALQFELMDSTLKLTTLGTLKVGDCVNVESALRVGDPLGGHFVSGHVDGIGRIIKIAIKGATKYLTGAVPDSLTRYLVEQGSVVVNGAALTIVKVGPPLNLPLVKGEKERVGSFSVALTPYTQKHTNLGKLRVGDKVNVEVDMLSKYIEKLLAISR